MSWCREVRPPPTVLEEDAQHYPEAGRDSVIISSNPHSCSSRARPLPSGQGANAGNLLFRSPFDRDPEPAASGHGGPVTEQTTSSPGALPSQQHENRQLLSAADKPRAPWKNPFVVPEMAEYSSAASQQPGADVAAPSPHAPRSPHIPSSNPFEDPPDQEPALDDESEEELQPELAMGVGENEGDDTDADSVQEVALDPGMGHLIAGGFGGSDSIGVSSSSPMPTPKKPPPGMQSPTSHTVLAMTPCMDSLRMAGTSLRHRCVPHDAYIDSSSTLLACLIVGSAGMVVLCACGHVAKVNAGAL